MRDTMHSRGDVLFLPLKIRGTIRVSRRKKKEVFLWLASFQEDLFLCWLPFLCELPPLRSFVPFPVHPQDLPPDSVLRYCLRLLWHKTDIFQKRRSPYFFTYGVEGLLLSYGPEFPRDRRGDGGPSEYFLSVFDNPRDIGNLREIICI
jgi:hypothetical protein